jgi:hypothetical protein
LLVVAVATYPVTPFTVVGVKAVGVLKVAPGELKVTGPVGAVSPVGTGIKKLTVTGAPEVAGFGVTLRVSADRGACATVTVVVVGVDA